MGVTALRRVEEWTAEARLRLDGPLARRHRASLVGEGERLVVFSHGLGTDQTSWRAVLPHLPQSCRAFLYDLPGAGPLLPAGFDPADYSGIDRFADDLLALLDEAGIERCTYVGHSVSGMIGALAAIEAPERFERLILLNASPRYLDDDGYVGGFDQAALEGLFAAMNANYQAWVAGFAPLAIAADTPRAVQEFSEGLLAMRPDVTAHVARTIFQSDVRHLLPLLEVPTLLVHARGDIAVPAEVAHFMASRIGQSAIEWIDADGHLPHLSAPGEVARVLRQCLA